MDNKFAVKFFLISLFFLFIASCSGDLSDRAATEKLTNSEDKTYENLDFKPTFYLKNKYNSRIKFPLPHLMEEYYTIHANVEEFSEFAISKGIETIDYKVRAVVEFKENIEGNIPPEVLERYEIQDGCIGKRWIKGYIPIYRFNALIEEFPDIHQIRMHKKPSTKAMVSEGFAKVNGTPWKTAGYTGNGMKIAVIDFGFEHIGDLVASGDFTTTYTGKDFSGYGFPGFDYHGTECAAIIYDFAPDAEYYLINVDEITDVEDAKDYCIANGINIISMSLAWDNDFYGEGLGDLCDIVNDAEAHGILWVNCSGNEGCDCYWTGDWANPDADDWHSFSGSDELNDIQLNYGETVFITLTWDTSLCNSDQDYDLLLFDSNLNQVDISDNIQDGNDQPIEDIIYTPTSSGTYYIGIAKYIANGTSKFRLFCSLDYCLEYADSSYSISTPGDAVGSLTVGAIDEYDWNSAPIEDFSSRGPTMDGRTKPDICGPDGTSEQYGWDYFYGTSCSTPHVAGVAAVYWSSNTAYTCSDVRSFIENRAIDCGTPGKDNIYGWGKLNLGSIPIPDDNYELNNSYTSAYDLSNNEQTWLNSIAGLGIQVDDDFFEIYVKDGYNQVKVECSFTHSQGNIELELLDSSGGSFTPVSGSSISTSISDNELIECKVPTFGTYYIRVFNADNGNQYDLWWDDILISPDTPTGFEINITTVSRIILKWNASAGAASYQLQRGLSDAGPWSEVYNGDNTSYANTRLSRNTTYWYCVRATNGVGSSNWSAPISGTTLNSSATSGGFCGYSTACDEKNDIQLVFLVVFLLTLICVRIYRKH